jgi:methionyl-tRNA synthetase
MNTLVTTAISYTNGSPHIGHLYESIFADFVKKIFVLNESNVKLLTGTDEHGKKIEESAKKCNMTSSELCDKYSQEFKNLNKKIGTDYDYFIRTTEEKHISLVKDIIAKCKDDIYLDKYVGWYSIREENYLTEAECKASNFKDPVTNIPYEKIEEPSYYFALGKYSNFIQTYFTNLKIGVGLKSNLLDRVKELKDLSITRTGFEWGIDMPLDSTNKHIIYVWFDALLNYVTGKTILFGDEDADIYHIIGKDIVWFHTVIYPSILKSAGLDNLITNNVLVHGFIMDKNGIKMGKSLGNAISVEYLTEKYNLDAIRYYLLANTRLNEDIHFSEDALKDLYNNDLIKNFGNLVQRVYKLVIPVQDKVNYQISRNKLQVDTELSLVKTTLKKVKDTFDMSEYFNDINLKIKFLNKLISDTKPWEKNDDEKVNILTELIIGLDASMLLLYPIIPEKISQLRNLFGLCSISNKIFTNYNLHIDVEDKQIKVFTPIK